MSQLGPGRTFWIAYVLTLTLVISGAMIRAQTTDSAPASAPSDATALRTDGIDEVIRGKFDSGMADLVKAAKNAPDDATTAQVLDWVRNYMTARERMSAQQQTEYRSDVLRVEHAMLAQAYLAGLNDEQKQQAAKLRELAGDISNAYVSGPNSEQLDEANLTGGRAGADELKAKVDANLNKALGQARQIAETLRDMTGQYALTLAQANATLIARLTDYQALWNADMSSDEARHAAANKLRGVEEQLSDALANMEALVSEEPWRVGLVQAKLAQQIAPQPAQVAQESWYKELVADVERRAEQAVKDARWYDALSAYAGLQDLDQDNEQYKEALKTTRAHVRVLRMYGNKNDANAGRLGSVRLKPSSSSAPASAPVAAEEELTWRDMVAGIDADMVRSTVAKVGDFYVSAVDYKKLAAGGLGALRVLAETPQAVESFPKLADADQKQAFLEAISRQLRNVDDQEQPDATSVVYAFNAVIRASEQTVEIPTAVLSMEFTDGMLDELDRFSSMIWPRDVTDFQKQTMGKFYGVGIQITKDPGEPLRVVTPLPDSPAMRAGVKPGDIILAVDGRPTETLSIDKLVDMIMGEQGSKVTLKLKRRGLIDPFEVSLTREQISIRTVKGWRQLDQTGKWDYIVDPDANIGYIRVLQFTDQTPVEIDDVIRELRRQGVRSLILDLRFNPGGLLRSATTICEEFVRQGRIVFTEGRAAEKTEIHAQRPGAYLQGDLVILVNEHSASAAEIVAGALKDLGRATIIGERTYGKGSVQQVYQIPNHKGFLKLTTAYYFVGDSGKLVHRTNGAKDWGVDPDVKVSISPRQMDRWLRIRRRTDLPQPDGKDAQLQGDLAAQLDADVQLSTAILLLKLKQVSEPVATAKE